MVSQPEQRPPEKFTAAVVFLVAAPLLALVGFLVFSALRVPERFDAAREEPSAGVEPAKVVEEPAPAVVPVEPSPKVEPEKVASRLAEAAKVEPPPSGRDVPWQVALDDSVVPVAYEELAFLPFGEAFAAKGRDDLRPWFEATPAAGFQVGKVPSRYGQSGMIDGVGRLLCPWPDRVVLRLDLENCDGLKLHFWRGETGVTLVYHEEGNRWVAHRTIREQGAVIPKTVTIVATDEGRCQRTEYRYGGAVEVRFVDGELLLSRGDVVLLAAAFEGKPSEVFFDGRAMINGIALARTKDAPRKYVSLSGEREVKGKQPTFAELLAAIDEAAQLLAGKEADEAVAADVLNRYARLGLWGADREGVPAWSSVRQAYHGAPIVLSRRSSEPEVSRAIRWELVSSVYRQQFEQVRDLIRRLRTFHQDRDKPLVEWAETLASGGGNGPAQNRDAWRGLLIEELSKEAYGSLTEIKAALEGEAWDDAARLIAALRPETSMGLAPALDDAALLTTVPVAVEEVLKERGEVRDAMAGQFAATAKLRIAQAIQADKADAIELATVQFAGMPAAADAERWLGDRALGEGRFAEAVKRYAQALKLVPEIAEELGPRLRLAGAMVGEVKGEPVSEPVLFGETKLPAEDFERLVQEMKTRAEGQMSLSLSEGAKRVPEAGNYVAKLRGRVEGAVGERPQEEGAKRTNQLRVPWVDRQLATAVAGNVMVVSNRFQVAAFDVAAGKWLWQSETPGQAMQRAQDWPLIPMRPLVGTDRIVTRLLYSGNPLLVCLDKKSGKLLWTVETREREAIVSDPLLINGHVVVLSAVNEGDQTLRVLWRAFDLQTGDAIGRKDLVRLRGSWGTRKCAQVALLEEGMVAVLGGVTLATNGQGEVRWVRKQLTLPAEDDPRWILQEYGVPVMDGGRVFVAQPGVRSVECLDVGSGARKWQTVLPEVTGVVGKSGEVLVVRTEDDVRGLSLADGTTKWRHAVTGVIGFPLVNESQVMIANREQGMGSEGERVRVTWIDSDEGKLMGSSVVEGVAEKELRLGPVTLVGERVMTLVGRGQNDPTRDVVEWVVTGKANAR